MSLQQSVFIELCTVAMSANAIVDGEDLRALRFSNADTYDAVLP